MSALADNTKKEGMVCVEFDNALECVNYDWKKYGYLTYRLLPPLNNLPRYELSFEIDQGTISIQCTYFTPEQLRAALSLYGFTNIQFFNIEIASEGLKEMPEDFWKDYSRCPASKYVTAIKA